MLRADLEDQAIVSGRNNRYYHHNLTPGLSIKTMRNGHALYTVAGGRFAVDEDVYLILNATQAYEIEIDSQTIVESFCVFFPDGWAEDVLTSLSTPLNKLLELPPNPPQIAFFEQLQPHDQIISPLMREIQTTLKGDVVSGGWLEEKIRLLLYRMFHVQSALYQQAEAIPTGAKSATRIELYRRLHLARDYMHASLAEPLSLEKIAGIAYMSPYHFLRTFKAVFGQTPHEYLTRKRIERAQFLLSRTDSPVTEICFSVGFESLGSFSTLFRRQVGVSPRGYRQEGIRV